MSTIKGRHYLPKIWESQSDCLVTYVLRKEQCRKNRLLSIPRKTKSLFLETENYLLVSKTVMDLCDLQFLSRHFWFKNQNDPCRKNFTQSAYSPFHTQRPGNYSIRLPGQKIFSHHICYENVAKATDRHSQKYWRLRLFSAITEQYVNREECNK